jgi:hypothetical protein
MSEEIRNLTKICYQTQTEVAVLKESHSVTRTMVEKIMQQNDTRGSLKTWHLGIATLVCSISSIIPHDKLLEILARMMN